MPLPRDGVLLVDDDPQLAWPVGNVGTAIVARVNVQSMTSISSVLVVLDVVPCVGEDAIWLGPVV